MSLPEETGILSAQARHRRHLNPEWRGDMYIPGTVNYGHAPADPEEQALIRQRETRTRNIYTRQEQYEREHDAACAKRYASGEARFQAMEACKRAEAERKLQLARGVIPSKQTTEEDKNLVYERVYEAFLDAMHVIGSWQNVSDEHKKYHTIMKLLDYNKSRINQTQDNFLHADILFPAFEAKYGELTTRKFKECWTRLSSIRRTFTPENDEHEKGLNAWRQEVLLASQILGMHVIQVQDKMPLFALEHEDKIRQKYGNPFLPYEDQNIKTG